ncbi:hypothetical protein ACFXP3_19195 [Streptomyces sp. NPDC059096]|uniref:hypothetical protein n=1 Tax=Streptomyces sp. NPDC059096 TaxID=3346727 RepID=UPI00368F8848
MNTDESQLHAVHFTWWKAPMVATALGLPILLRARFELLGDEDDVMRPLMVTVVILLAIVWLVPHRRSMRAVRVLAAGMAYGASCIPIAYVLRLFVAAVVAI